MTIAWTKEQLVEFERVLEKWDEELNKKATRFVEGQDLHWQAVQHQESLLRDCAVAEGVNPDRAVDYAYDIINESARNEADCYECGL